MLSVVLGPTQHQGADASGCGYVSFSTFTAPALDGLRPSALAAYCSPPFTGFGYFLAVALARDSFTCGCALGGDRLAWACKHTLGDALRSRHDNGVPRLGGGLGHRADECERTARQRGGEEISEAGERRRALSRERRRSQTVKRRRSK